MVRSQKILCVALLPICALFAGRVFATGVPVGGFLPVVGIGLSNEYDTQNFDLFAEPNTAQPTSSMMLGNGSPNFDFALLDTGAGFSLLTSQAYNDFNIDGPYSGNADGFAGTETIDFGGATGSLTAAVNEPLGLYASGLQNRTGSATTFGMNLNAMKGQTNTSMVTAPPESDLPNVVGVTFASRYATYIRNDQPQIFTLNGRTVRAPSIDFLPMGTGGSQNLLRRSDMQNNPSGALSGKPLYTFNLQNLDIDHPWADPSAPTLLQTSTGGSFLNVTAADNGTLPLSQFLFDTGADVTVVSTLTANQLGYDGMPDFTVAVIGSGGTAFGVPGFFVNDFTILAQTASNNGQNNIVLHNVPVIILNVKSPADPDNNVPGIVGTNLFAGRNIIYDPNNSAGPSLFSSDPVTNNRNWTTTAASGTWNTGGNWTGGTAPTVLSISNVRYVSGGNQTAIISANAIAWEVNVSGTANNTMTLQVQSGVTLQTYSGINIEQGGAINLQNGTLDTQYLELFAGTLSGQGTITTGSGPIPGQVENRTGTIAPGNGIGELDITGRFASGPISTLSIELGGLAAGQSDRIAVTGDATIDGTLAISLVNGFIPSVGDSIAILTATDGVGGTFSHVTGPDGYNWRVNYLATSVQVVVGNPGDFNNDGVVDAGDYVTWRQNSGGPLNFAAWRSHFGMTYGSGATTGTSTGVPEPGSLLLLAAAACLLSRKRMKLA